MGFGQLGQFEKTVLSQQGLYGRVGSGQKRIWGKEYDGESGHSATMATMGYQIPSTDLWRGYEMRSNAEGCTRAGFISRNQPCLGEACSTGRRLKRFYRPRICERLKL
jgi:hypothetical protein